MICPTNSVGSYKYRLYGINKKSIKSINYTHSKTKGKPIPNIDRKGANLHGRNEFVY